MIWKVWMKVMRVIAVCDVLLAAVLLTIYVYLLSDHLPELQIIQGSKRYHLIVYIYVCVCTLVQLLTAFKFYQVLTIPRPENENIEIDDLLPITKIWIIASYFLLFNWALKAGIYAQKCQCGISVALCIYMIEIAFRLATICIGSTYMKKLEKAFEEMKVQIKMQNVVASYTRGRTCSICTTDCANNLQQNSYQY